MSELLVSPRNFKHLATVSRQKETNLGHFGIGYVCGEKYALLLPSPTISENALFATKPNHISNCHLCFVQKSNILVVVLSV